MLIIGHSYLEMSCYYYYYYCNEREREREREGEGEGGRDIYISDY